MRPTIKHIADLAGVSKTTVSFAFNDPSKISRLTYERIMAIADAEGYVPDPVARSMTTKRAGAIGVLLPQAIQESLRNPYVAEVLRGIGAVCHQEDLFLTVLPPLKGFLTNAVRNAAVDGFIALGVEAAPEIAALIRQRLVPFVTVDGDAGLGIVNFGIDDEAAAERVMDYVLSFGHERIAVLSLNSELSLVAEEHSSRTGSRRLAGFSRSLELHGLSLRSPRVPVCPVDSTLEAAREAASRLLRELRPTAFVCMSDIAAIGVYAACAQEGLSVPEDVSVTGMDDIPFSFMLDPPLSTIRQPGVQKGSFAAAAIIELMRGGKPASVVLPAELVVRRSVAPPSRA
ncbi:MAG: hypothetical protein A2Z99_11130 [Treponema sp. GWB1_62_6]|nr:MAG: hypothetical protein A2Y36_07545 [Treponema sp. GWA1_62_8]OHE66406.1 MAG: hypothetical protein A2001_19255 [Treponema sp. GWC1_61_84]OHE67991.1 MAG: hypothetical protein A2Z99_11130 [Treponema sp. GWB1_62_6]OHE74273.1 MAG: hypothetical protein A2413_01640 [Treponema sp. RIFOXYC1_FULL_61_9]HCM27120.1 hypothetical protein [Treponema sp.]